MAPLALLIYCTSYIVHTPLGRTLLGSCPSGFILLIGLWANLAQTQCQTKQRNGEHITTGLLLWQRGRTMPSMLLDSKLILEAVRGTPLPHSHFPSQMQTSASPHINRTNQPKWGRRVGKYQKGKKTKAPVPTACSSSCMTVNPQLPCMGNTFMHFSQRGRGLEDASAS